MASSFHKVSCQAHLTLLYLLAVEVVAGLSVRFTSPVTFLCQPWLCADSDGQITCVWPYRVQFWFMELSLSLQWIEYCFHSLPALFLPSFAVK